MSVSRVILPAVLVIAIGGGIGLADLAIRNEKVKLGRTVPPPPPPPLGREPEPPVVKPVAPASNDGKPVEKPAMPDGEPTVQPKADPAVTPPTPKAVASLPPGHITIEQGKALFDQNSIFVDARKSEVYAEGHVAGAFRADMASFKSGDPRWVANFPKDLTLVVYCSGGDCDESEHVAQLLEASGFKTIYVMHDGFPGWKAAGHPIETGEGQE